MSPPVSRSSSQSNLYSPGQNQAGPSSSSSYIGGREIEVTNVPPAAVYPCIDLDAASQSKRRRLENGSPSLEYSLPWSTLIEHAKQPIPHLTERARAFCEADKVLKEVGRRLFRGIELAPSCIPALPRAARAFLLVYLLDGFSKPFIWDYIYPTDSQLGSSERWSELILPLSVSDVGELFNLQQTSSKALDVLRFFVLNKLRRSGLIKGHTELQKKILCFLSCYKNYWVCNNPVNPYNLPYRVMTIFLTDCLGKAILDRDLFQKILLPTLLGPFCNVLNGSISGGRSVEDIFSGPQELQLLAWKSLGEALIEDGARANPIKLPQEAKSMLKSDSEMQIALKYFTEKPPPRLPEPNRYPFLDNIGGRLRLVFTRESSGNHRKITSLERLAANRVMPFFERSFEKLFYPLSGEKTFFLCAHLVSILQKARVGRDLPWDRSIRFIASCIPKIKASSRDLNITLSNIDWVRRVGKSVFNLAVLDYLLVTEKGKIDYWSGPISSSVGMNVLHFLLYYKHYDKVAEAQRVLKLFTSSKNLLNEHIILSVLDKIRTARSALNNESLSESGFLYAVKKVILETGDDWGKEAPEEKRSRWKSCRPNIERLNGKAFFEAIRSRKIVKIECPTSLAFFLFFHLFKSFSSGKA